MCLGVCFLAGGDVKYFAAAAAAAAAAAVPVLPRYDEVSRQIYILSSPSK